MNFNDITAAVKKWQGAPTAPHLTWVDVEGEVPNAVINFSDIQRIVHGFQGQTYPYRAPQECP